MPNGSTVSRVDLKTQVRIKIVFWQAKRYGVGDIEVILLYELWNYSTILLRSYILICALMNLSLGCLYLANMNHFWSWNRSNSIYGFDNLKAMYCLLSMKLYMYNMCCEVVEYWLYSNLFDILLGLRLLLTSVSYKIYVSVNKYVFNLVCKFD